MKLWGSVVLIYFILGLSAKFGLVPDWQTTVGENHAGPSLERLSLWFGTDFLGRSVLYKVLHATGTAMSVGLITSVIGVFLGVGFGALAGYYGRWVDQFVVWLYTSIASIPHILLLIALSLALGKGIFAIYIAIGFSSWIGLARVVRAEFIKHRDREYVLAAKSLGVSSARQVIRHILPNIFHLVIIDFSIRFQAAIKAEVILSFLGLGVQNSPSWGVMINEARPELIRGQWWSFVAATLAMFFIVFAFNLLGDELRDRWDPKRADRLR